MARALFLRCAGERPPAASGVGSPLLPRCNWPQAIRRWRVGKEKYRFHAV